MKLILKVLDDIVETDYSTYLIILITLECVGCLVRNFIVAYTVVISAIVILALCLTVRCIAGIAYLVINWK